MLAEPFQLDVEDPVGVAGGVEGLAGTGQAQRRTAARRVHFRLLADQSVAARHRELHAGDGHLIAGPARGKKKTSQIVSLLVSLSCKSMPL